jgi:hypothetical protein
MVRVLRKENVDAHLMVLKSTKSVKKSRKITFQARNKLKKGTYRGTKSTTQAGEEKEESNDVRLV